MVKSILQYLWVLHLHMYQRLTKLEIFKLMYLIESETDSTKWMLYIFSLLVDITADFSIIHNLWPDWKGSFQLTFCQIQDMWLSMWLFDVILLWLHNCATIWSAILFWHHIEKYANSCDVGPLAFRQYVQPRKSSHPWVLPSGDMPFLFHVFHSRQIMFIVWHFCGASEAERHLVLIGPCKMRMPYSDRSVRQSG